MKNIFLLALTVFAVFAACASANEVAPAVAEIIAPPEVITYEPFEPTEPNPAGFITIHPPGYAAGRAPVATPDEPAVLSVQEIPEPYKIIALTFDDGPYIYTDDLLDILDRYDAKVTFFLIGDMVANGADTVRRAYAAGHEILGHSWDHSDHRFHSAQEVSRQIVDTSVIIEYVTGSPPPPLFRVPFGHNTANIRRAAYERGYSFLNWSIDPRDWYNRCEYYLYEFIMARATDGAVIVLHDIHPTTVIAMERVVPDLIAQGFQLVTATELIYQVYGGLVPGEQFRGRR